MPDHGGTHGPSEGLARYPEQARAPWLPQSRSQLKHSRNHTM
jgi:hypothetical protein